MIGDLIMSGAKWGVRLFGAAMTFAGLTIAFLMVLYLISSIITAISDGKDENENKKTN